MTKGDVIKRLKEDRHDGYPGHQARLDEEWFAALSEDDRTTVTEVLRELLLSREELGPVLWFLSWVAPLPRLAPELAALAPHIDSLVETSPSLLGRNSYLAMYVHVVGTLGVREVLPHLHKWASMGNGSTSIETYLAEHAAVGLLHFSKEGAVKYAPGILEGDIRFDSAVKYSATQHFISNYLRLYPHDVAPLAQAYSGLGAAYSEYVYQAVQMAAGKQVEIGSQDSTWRESVLNVFSGALFQ